MLNHEWRMKVRFGETDAAGIVFYPNYYKWMDQATHELMLAAGFSTRKLMEENVGLPLLEANCRFREPLRFDDEVKVVSSIEEVKTKVIRIAHRFYREETLIAEGYEVRVWAVFQSGALKADALPDALRQRLLS
ncbi:thioesterase family protein [Cohnella sp. AR92]|uniref:acyl-CoA thioesterase n=1 Tax=Cohnella sp. AR92 TaxID=648716 RepID=UPI000F8D4107|nr:thioesterase family protein [Cohnella sp. AR92]RUS45728.1 acyl-CoA thioesterase [Cohnella sp. AR92]